MRQVLYHLIKRALSAVDPTYQLFRKLSGVLRYPSGTTVRVLTFHDISPAYVDAFKRELKAVQRRFEFVEPSRFDQIRSTNGGADKEFVLLTFDDGFICQRRVAESVLGPLGIRAIFFLPPAFLECVGLEEQYRFVRERFHRKVRFEEVSRHLGPMSWSDVKWLLAQGHLVGSHTMHHLDLSGLTEAELVEAEISEAKSRLTKRIGIEVRHFAFPFGGVSRRAIQIAQSYHAFLHSTMPGSNSPGRLKSTINRYCFDEDDPPGYLTFVLCGGLDWYYYRRRKNIECLVKSYGT